jgi:hypothetical protein
MERLATSMLAGEAPLAYLVSHLCLAKIYATFVDKTEARNAKSRIAFGGVGPERANYPSER